MIMFDPCPFRMNFVSMSCNTHFAKMKFLENKHQMQAFLTLAESKVKSWIIKYGWQESVQLILQNYVVSTDFQILWVNSQNTVVGFINILIEDAFVYILLFIFVLYRVFISHLLRSSISLKNTSRCSSPWNSRLRPLSLWTARVRSWTTFYTHFTHYVKSKKTTVRKKDAVLDTVTQ